MVVVTRAFESNLSVIRCKRRQNFRSTMVRFRSNCCQLVEGWRALSEM